MGVYVGNVTIRVPDELKRRMEELREVNWSEVARSAFEETVQRQEMRRAADEVKAMRECSDPAWDGSAEIRRWRDASR
jgi:predicted transcriptional regulator